MFANNEIADPNMKKMLFFFQKKNWKLYCDQRKKKHKVLFCVQTWW